MYTTSSEILKDYKKLKALIKDYDLQLQDLDYDTTGPRAIDYGADKISPTNAFNSDTENTAIKREDRIKELRLKQRVDQIIIDRLDNARTVLTERENQLIELRYMGEDKKQCKEVAAEMGNMPLKEYYKLHKKIIDKIDNLIFRE